jgi:hypothetical protein
MGELSCFRNGSSLQAVPPGRKSLNTCSPLWNNSAPSLAPGSEAIAQGVKDPKFHSNFITHTCTKLKPETEFS